MACGSADWAGTIPGPPATPAQQAHTSRLPPISERIPCDIAQPFELS